MSFTLCTPAPQSELSPSSPPPPSTCLSPLQPPSPTGGGKYLVVEAVVCSTVFHSISFCLCFLQMFIAMSHWSSMRPLASATPSILEPHWDSSSLSCWCPVSWRSCSFGSVGPAPSHTPAVHRKTHFLYPFVLARHKLELSEMRDSQSRNYRHQTGPWHVCGACY